MARTVYETENEPRRACLNICFSRRGRRSRPIPLSSSSTDASWLLKVPNNMLSLTMWFDTRFRAPSVHGCLRGRKSDLVRFHRLKEGQRRQKGTFDKEWAAKLAESNKGSFYDQEKLPDELDRD